MRADAFGLFWENVKLVAGRINAGPRPLPPIPPARWTAPTTFPRLEAAACIGVDTETYDPELTEYGPGWARGTGHLVGLSVAVPDGPSWYFPMRHELQPEMNLDPQQVLRWAADELSRQHQPKVGANLMYDVGWLAQEGVTVRGELIDVQFAEALLQEYAKTSLEVLGQKYLNTGKESPTLYRWLAEAYGGPPTEEQRKNIYRSPVSLAGPYAEADASLPLQIIKHQYPLLHEQNLLDLFLLECRLIPLLVKMRQVGVRVDVKKAEQLRDVLLKREEEAQKQLDDEAGQHIDVNSATSIARAFDKAGVSYKFTATNKPSFTKDFLKEVQHPTAGLIVEVRKLNKLRKTFVENYVINAQRGGKLHCQFHPLRGDKWGARSGRYSSSDPNLQNIPIRDEELGRLIRGLFIPDDGHRQWRRYDLQQIEYRFLAHYAVGDGADTVRLQYATDPSTDYHRFAQKMIADMTGQELPRKSVKNINFGLVYGMGTAKLGASLGLDQQSAQQLFSAYHSGLPFVRATMQATEAEMLETGVITTVLGRRARFDLWEPAEYTENAVALPFREASLIYPGRLRRAHAHKALNRRLQGSAADLMKKAMLECYQSGVFDAIGVPRLTVHDELDFSDATGRDEDFAEFVRIYENAIPLRVPIVTDCDVGPDWGACS